MSVQRTPADVLQFAKDNDAKVLDLRFADLPGLWQHVSYPITMLEEDSFEDGFGFDGSSIRGWQAISESDMLIMPDANTAFMDPFTDIPTLVLVCTIVDPITKQHYERDPRWIAQKAENYMAMTGVGDTAYFGAEAEFFIFDNIRFDQSHHYGFYYIDSEEGRWNSGRPEHNLGYRPRYKEGYFPVPPTDHHMNIRSGDGARSWSHCGHQHRVPPPRGRHRRPVPRSTSASTRLVTSADNMMLYKYVVRNVAFSHGRTVTFMPKPLVERQRQRACTRTSPSGSKGEPLFAGDQYAGMSELALHYIGGLLKHSPALAAFVAPTTNSYKRLVPGFEAPVNLAYSRRNRSAACRIPMYSASPKSKRVELRFPDPACNPYLAFSAMLMAGLDGIQNKIDPGEPLDKDIYDLSPEELRNVPALPTSLEGALDALEADHDFLTQNDVFTEEVIQSYLEYKRTAEVDEVRQRPHPYEFSLYYDI